MKKYLLYFILLVLAGFFILFISTSDEFNWLRAKMGDKSTDYAQYMKAYPDGWHYFEAQKRFDKQCWIEAKQAGTIEHFQNYIKLNPDGLYVETAKKNIDSITWSNIKQKNSIEDSELFLTQNPESQYVQEAQEEIERLAWEQLLRRRDIEEVKTYIETHPDGKYIEDTKYFLEDLMWAQASMEDTDDSYLEYIKLYPDGRYSVRAANSMSKPLSSIPIFVDSYHLYELTSFDKDYGYLFEKKIKDIISELKSVKMVSDIADANIYLQIGYALSFREGQADDDNISKFIENRWTDRTIIKSERLKATYDIALNLYLWDLSSDCLIAFSSSVVPPETGNAAISRDIGRELFLDHQVGIHVENSFIRLLGEIRKGENGVMFIPINTPTSFIRGNAGMPEKRVFVKFENGPISIFHWRDPSIEKYIYHHLYQADMDCVRIFDEHSYKLQVTWSKYNRIGRPSLPLRDYGLKADFTIYEKDKKQQDKVAFDIEIISDFSMNAYGLSPIEVINQWRKVFDTTYAMEKIIQNMKAPTLCDLPESAQ